MLNFYTKSTVSLKALTPVLREWTAVVDICAIENPNDSCWSYGERAAISIFAGAAWKVGWFAAEEFGTRKIGDKLDDLPGRSMRRRGRCDLYLDDRSESYVVEAKQAWQAIGPRVSKPTSEVTTKMGEACRDAASVPNIEANRRLALTFVAPSFPVSLLAACVDDSARHVASTQIIAEWLRKVKAINRIGAMAWSFPPISRCLTDPDSKRVFPGTVALVQECKQATHIGKR